MSNSRLVPLALVALAGCTVGPNFQSPTSPAATAYTGAGEASSPAPTAPAIADLPTPLRWWEAFGSPDLNALVDRAIAHNENLAAANATLAAANQQARAVAGRALPQVDANARVEREEANLAAYGFDSSVFPGISNPTFDLYTVGGGVSYDLDLFGANRRRTEQARAQAESQLRQTQAAHLTIAGRVVNQVLTIAAIRARIDTTHALLDDDQRLIDLTEARRKGGEGTLVEVLNAQSELADDRGALPGLAQQLDEARHMLATLVGATPDAIGPTEFQLETFVLPQQVPVAIPSALVRKRPDILQAEADLHAATAAVGVATAQLYPDITIGISGTTSAGMIGDLFGPGFRAFDAAAGLSAPLFHGGTLKAGQRAAVDQMQASAASYRQTVLDSFRQVADLLAALGNDQRAVETERNAADLAGRNHDLSNKSFKVGNTGITTVLDAERLNQRAQLNLVQARAQQFIDIARLYVATAGGWTGPATETAAAAP